MTGGAKRLKGRATMIQVQLWTSLHLTCSGLSNRLTPRLGLRSVIDSIWDKGQKRTNRKDHRQQLHLCPGRGHDFLTRYHRQEPRREGRRDAARTGIWTMTSRRKHHLKNFGRMSFKEQLDSLNTIDYSSRWKRRGDDPTVQLSEYICLTCTLHSHWVVSFFPQDLFQRASKFHKRIWWISWVAGLFVEKIKLAPVGSTVRYEMMKLCTGSV